MDDELTKDVVAKIDKHMTSLEQARDKAQDNLSEVIKFAAGLQEDFNKMLQGYKEELHSAKAKIEMLESRNIDVVKRNERLTDKYDKLHDAYDKLMEKYEALAERSLDKNGGAARSDVSIKM